MDAISLTERTLVSIFRTAIYAGLAAALGFTRTEFAPLLDGIILGASIADFITWLLRSLMLMPENISHGIYDTAVNVAFACFFFHVAAFPINDDGTMVMFAFTSFMIVLGLKIGYYGLQTVGALAHE